MMDILELLVEIGKRSGVIPGELLVSFTLLIFGIKGYAGSKDASDIVELLVYAGSLACLTIGVCGLILVPIQYFSR